MSALSEPDLELLGMHDVDDAIPRHLGLDGDGGGVGVELEVFWRMGVGREQELATGIHGEPGGALPPGFPGPPINPFACRGLDWIGVSQNHFTAKAPRARR